MQEDDILEHFGVKGMKWGVRKQVTPQKQASRDKKAAFYEKKSARLQKRIEKLDQRNPITPSARANQDAMRAELVRLKNRADKDAERKRQGKLTTSQRRTVAATAAITAVFLASAFSKKTVDLPQEHAYASKAEDLIQSERKKQMYSLTRMHKEGKMDAAQFKKFSETLNARYDRKLAEALLEDIQR